MRFRGEFALSSPANPHDPLARLTRIIAASVRAEADAGQLDADPVRAQLNGVRTGRIRQLTVELRAPAASRIDAVDAVLMQTLLKDFRAVVTRLRSVTHHTDQRLARVAAAVKEGTRLFPTAIDSRDK